MLQEVTKQAQITAADAARYINASNPRSTVFLFLPYMIGEVIALITVMPVKLD